MYYSSLPLTSKLFQLTSLTCALALAGCGGDDTVDSIAPAPDLGVQPGTGSGNGNNNGGGNNGGEQTPNVEPDFFLQKLSTTPTIIELSDEQTNFSVTVKAAEVSSGGAIVGKAVTLKVVDSENNASLSKVKVLRPLMEMVMLCIRLSSTHKPLPIRLY